MFLKGLLILVLFHISVKCEHPTTPCSSFSKEECDSRVYLQDPCKWCFNECRKEKDCLCEANEASESECPDGCEVANVNKSEFFVSKEGSCGIVVVGSGSDDVFNVRLF